MKISDIITEGLRDPADNPCWKGYHPVGTKKKAGRTVPNCVPTNEASAEYDDEAGTADQAKAKKPGIFQAMKDKLLAIGRDADKIKRHDPEKIKLAITDKLAEIDDPQLTQVTQTFLQKVTAYNRKNPAVIAAVFGFTFAIIARVSMQVSHHFGLTPTQATLLIEATLPTIGNFLGYLVNGFSVKDSIQAGLIAGSIGVGGTMAASGALSEQDIQEDWQKVNKQDKTAGMSKKAVKAYRREHPGSKLQTAVTTKPSKLKKGSKASKRRKSFCARSAGQKKMHNIDCSKDPDKAICAARRRWNCE